MFPTVSEGAWATEGTSREHTSSVDFPKDSSMAAWCQQLGVLRAPCDHKVWEGLAASYDSGAAHKSDTWWNCVKFKTSYTDIMGRYLKSNKARGNFFDPKVRC